MINFNLLFLVLFIAGISYVIYTLFIKKEKNDKDNTENINQDSTPENSEEPGKDDTETKNDSDTDRINQDSIPEDKKDTGKDHEKPFKFIEGMIFTLIVNILAYIPAFIILILFLGMTGGGAIFAFGIVLFPIGLIQLLYIVPFIYKLRARGKHDTADSVVAGAILTAILNVIFYIFVFSGGLFHK